ncbi:MAG: hypothetical protein ACR2RL_08345 [Gammaproteobacteria bacterium]
MTKAEYGAELERNLAGLVERMKRMSYRPGPVREVLMPKAGAPGATMPLGISTVEDKVVQGRMRKVLEAVYELVFLRVQARPPAARRGQSTASVLVPARD